MEYNYQKSGAGVFSYSGAEQEMMAVTAVKEVVEARTKSPSQLDSRKIQRFAILALAEDQN
jgi:hypothetical protein